MSRYSETLDYLDSHPHTWLVTGAAGFIGSHICETLLKHNQRVLGLDNLSTGFRNNIDEIQNIVGPSQAQNLTFVEGDIRDTVLLKEVFSDVDFVLHQAALGSVPRSLEDPWRTHDSNVNGFLNVLISARDRKVKKFVYASSSSVYGDNATLPKIEDQVGNPLSPYAVSKKMNELYSRVFSAAYGISTIGIRYFNVFGARQDPFGPYAAVIPKWISAILSGDEITINGSGEISRDFTYVANVVQLNILSAFAKEAPPEGLVFNGAVSQKNSLFTLLESLERILRETHPEIKNVKPKIGPYRKGDIRDSLADIQKAVQILGYEPTHTLEEGLKEAMPFYLRICGQK